MLICLFLVSCLHSLYPYTDQMNGDKRDTSKHIDIFTFLHFGESSCQACCHLHQLPSILAVGLITDFAISTAFEWTDSL